MVDGEAIPIKLRLGNSVGRLRIDRDKFTVSNLQAEIQRWLGRDSNDAPFGLRYLDEDGSEIDILSDRDLIESLNIFDHHQQMNTLQIVALAGMLRYVH